MAGRNRAGRWDSEPVLPWAFGGAERLPDLPSVGWSILSAGKWNDGDVAGGRCIKVGGSGKRQCGDSDPIPQWECGPKLDEQFSGGSEDGRKPRDWNLFTQWRGIDAGQLGGWKPGVAPYSNTDSCGDSYINLHANFHRDPDTNGDIYPYANTAPY